MQITEHQTRVPLRLVISAGQRPAVERKRQSRPAHVRLVVDEKPRRKLLAAMSYAAATRRQAARRLRRKLQVERATSMLLISFLVATAAAQLLFGGSNASAAQRPVWALTLVTTISALLTVWRATVEQTVYAICEFELLPACDRATRVRSCGRHPPLTLRWCAQSAAATVISCSSAMCAIRWPTTSP